LFFGGFAEKNKIDFDWEITKLEIPANRLPKEIFYIPAMLLLGGVLLIQNRRRKKQTV
jgi:hypothetical protein